ncbi:hypothetical protein [Pajaroellobacter abortibovis]|uniref:hypothetical protein n=1 Tax=Pajaroellobacter abortibovis TaxID=1882918 RepID=UPI003B82DA2C
MLAALQVIPLDLLRGIFLLGELSLTECVHPVRGVLPQLLSLQCTSIDRILHSEEMKLRPLLSKD